LERSQFEASRLKKGRFHLNKAGCGGMCLYSFQLHGGIGMRTLFQDQHSKIKTAETLSEKIT
jgi:hypothetical protein